MNLEHIPKTFWHALSLSIVLLTIGFITITYRSGSFTLKYADLEFQTNAAKELIFDAKETLTAALAESEHDREKLGAEKAALETEKERLAKSLSDVQAQLSKFIVANKSAPGTISDTLAIEKLKEELTGPILGKKAEYLSKPASGRKPASETPASAVEARPQLNQVQLKIDQLTRLHSQIVKG
ncbi:MAG: hypothetical protein HYV96_21150 [Opitutae bacterium]|nr:hypothetical protein [Opitutae bacterium]